MFGLSSCFDILVYRPYLALPRIIHSKLDLFTVLANHKILKEYERIHLYILFLARVRLFSNIPPSNPSFTKIIYIGCKNDNHEVFINITPCKVPFPGIVYKHSKLNPTMEKSTELPAACLNHMESTSDDGTVWQIKIFIITIHLSSISIISINILVTVINLSTSQRGEW